MAYTQEFLDNLAEAQDVFVWEAPAWEHIERPRAWYMWMAGITLALLAYAILTSNYLFAFIVLISAIILVLAGNEHPKPVLVQIGGNGLVYNGQLFLFDQLRQFSIIYHPPQTKVLYIEPKGSFQTRLRIELGEQDPVAIRNHLKQFVDENLVLRDEHISDIFGRLLKI